MVRSLTTTGDRAAPDPGPDTTGVDRAVRRVPRHGVGPVVAVAVGLLVLLGIAMRVWMLWHSPMVSDEANAGLEARAILHGHFYTFFWGGVYGGIEPYVIVPFVAVFGGNPIALNVVPVLLYAICCLLVWRVGLLTFRNRAVAAIAAALAWAWPEANTWLSTRESGFRGATFVCGLLVLLFAARVAYRSDRGSLGDWVVLGLSAGAGWWSSPEIVYFLVPAAVLLLAVKGRRLAAGDGAAWARAGAFLAAAVLGALPWLYTNFQTSFASLSQRQSPTTYTERLHVFFTKVLPILLGLRYEGAGQWIVTPRVGYVLYALVLAVLVVGGVLIVRSVPRAAYIVLAAAAYPFIYAVFPPNGQWNDARYGALLVPVLALLLVGGVWQIGVALSARRMAATATPSAAPDRHRPARTAAAGVAGLAGLALVVVADLAAFNATLGRPLGSWSRLTSYGPDANAGARQVIATLSALHVRDAYATYWISYDVMFLSDTKIMMTEVDDVRWRGAWDAVNASANPAWVYVDPADTTAATAAFGVSDFGEPESQILSYLHAHRVPYAFHHIGLIDVIQPAVRVTAPQVGYKPVFIWNPA